MLRLAFFSLSFPSCLIWRLDSPLLLAAFSVGVHCFGVFPSFLVSLIVWKCIQPPYFKFLALVSFGGFEAFQYNVRDALGILIWIALGSSIVSFSLPLLVPAHLLKMSHGLHCSGCLRRMASRCLSLIHCLRDSRYL